MQWISSGATVLSSCCAGLQQVRCSSCDCQAAAPVPCAATEQCRALQLNNHSQVNTLRLLPVPS